MFDLLFISVAIVLLASCLYLNRRRWTRGFRAWLLLRALVVMTAEDQNHVRLAQSVDELVAIGERVEAQMRGHHNRSSKRLALQVLSQKTQGLAGKGLSRVLQALLVMGEQSDEVNAGAVECVGKRTVAPDQPLLHGFHRRVAAFIVVAEDVEARPFQPACDQLRVRVSRGGGGPFRDVAATEHERRFADLPSKSVWIRRARQRVHGVDGRVQVRTLTACLHVLVRPTEESQFAGPRRRRRFARTRACTEGDKQRDEESGDLTLHGGSSWLKHAELIWRRHEIGKRKPRPPGRQAGRAHGRAAPAKLLDHRRPQPKPIGAREDLWLVHAPPILDVRVIKPFAPRQPLWHLPSNRLPECGQLLGADAVKSGQKGVELAQTGGVALDGARR